MANTAGPRAEVLRSRDFIGWAVTSANGANVGTVSDILIGRDGKVRFLAIDPGFFKKPYLLPVEALEWGEGSLQTTWTDTEVRALPPYDAGTPLTADVLEELRRTFPRHYGSRVGQPVSAEGATVVPLRDAKDFRLAKGAPNLKGWAVYAKDNEKVGTVTQMLVDPVAMKVRYIDVDLADDLFGLSDDRHVLVPLEIVELRERSEDVWVPSFTGADIARLPAYLGGAVDAVLEQETERAFNTSYYRADALHDDVGAPREEARALPAEPPTLPPPDEPGDTMPRESAGPPAIRDAEFAAPPPLPDDEDRTQ